MHALNPRRRRIGEPLPSAGRARGCITRQATIAQLLSEELLTVRHVFRVDVTREALERTAHRMLSRVMSREIPDGAVGALSQDLRSAAAQGSFTLTDVEVRLWFLGWMLDGAHASRRSP